MKDVFQQTLEKEEKEESEEKKEKRASVKKPRKKEKRSSIKKRKERKYWMKKEGLYFVRIKAYVCILVVLVSAADKI